jgi:hypothetical protein
MEVQPDFRDLLELFNKHQVEFMLVGGYALAFHGAPRYTGDMALFVSARFARRRLRPGFSVLRRGETVLYENACLRRFPVTTNAELQKRGAGLNTFSEFLAYSESDVEVRWTRPNLHCCYPLVMQL